MAIDVFHDFIQGGCTPEQANKIITYYKKIYLSPFDRINIQERLKDFQDMFAQHGKTPKETIRKIAQMPAIFLNDPDTFDKTIQACTRHFKFENTEKWLKIVWSNPTLLTKSVISFEQTIKDQAAVLGLSKDEWQKRAFKRPPILSVSAQAIKKNIDINAAQFGLSKKEWIETAIKDAELLYADPENLLQKVKQNAKTFKTDIKTVCRAFFKYPAMFYFDPDKTRQKVEFLTNMYLTNLIQMKKENGKKNPEQFLKYLLNNPLYIRSIESLQQRCVYARYLKSQNMPVGLRPVYFTDKAIEQALEKAPPEFWKKERILSKVALAAQKITQQAQRE